MQLTNRQLSLMQAISKDGIPVELMDIFLGRCGASEEEWGELQINNLVEKDKKLDRWFLTLEGRRLFKKEKMGRYY